MNFALIGAAGFVAPRHLQAIAETDHRLVAAVDPHDSVGRLDQYAPGCRFFTEIERFDRHLAKRARGPEAERVHYVSICSPNYLHDAHIRLALRAGAHAICEKPIVLSPWNLDALADLEQETGLTVSTVLQLRLHPALRARRDALLATPAMHKVALDYVTPRGRWYDVSWKGVTERSGGIAMNIGVHLFDLLLWLFGAVEHVEVTTHEPRRMAGWLQLAQATVVWRLSVEAADHPGGGPGAYRALTIDGERVEFSDGFTALHTRVYEETLAGRRCTLDEARPAIELAYRLRCTPMRAGLKVSA